MRPCQSKPRSIKQTAGDHLPSRYLERYAEHIDDALRQGLAAHDVCYRQVLCIPAYREPVDFLRHLPCLQDGHKWLLILVINQPMTDDNCPANAELYEHITRHYRRVPQQSSHLVADVSATHSALFIGPEHDILLIDRFSPARRINARAGVGLARKIACDLACELIQQGRISSEWIHSSDADVRFPPDYFSAVETLPEGCSACVFPYTHAAGDGLQTAVALYELALNYYCAGLHWAGSDYAFHTIGSCMAFHYRHYAKVRGFPKRAGGEDFYLLNKLNKTGVVLKPSTPQLRLQGRLSTRVPFGTGPAISRISTLPDARTQYQYYHPRVFTLLKCWLASYPALWQVPADVSETAFYAQLKTLLNRHGCQQETDQLLQALQQLNSFAAHVQGKRNARQERHYLKHWRDWFDAFRTLKLIHYLRDHHYASVPLAALAESTSFLRDILDATQLAALRNPTIDCGQLQDISKRLQVFISNREEGKSRR